MLALVERWNRDVAPLATVPIGRNANRLTRSRAGESLVGNLVSDAIRNAAGADLALLNNGALRADLPEGTVTRGMIYDLMPFEITVVTTELTGAEVRRTIEEGLRHEHLTQVSGLRYTFDLGAPEFARVVALSNADGTAFDETRTYRIACNVFMAEGGDGYETLTRGRNLTDTMVSVRDRIEELIASRSRDGGAIDYRPEQRVVRAPGSRPPARGD
jgi:2',3'-cyclic-nucleotide 2'-phosphodiesterase/3'-nucleotidase